MAKIVATLVLFCTLGATVNAVVFDCVQLKEYYWPVIGTFYSCYQAVAVSNLENPIVTAITGIHMAGRSNIDVRGFYILSHTNLTYIPQGLEKFFPNMIALAIGHGSGIREISGCDLKNYGKLQLVAVGGNQIERVPGDFLKFTPDVVVFYIHYNKIKHFGSGIFPAILKLKSLDFTFNDCVDKKVSGNVNELYDLIGIIRTNCTDTERSSTTHCSLECSPNYIPERVCSLETRSTNLEDENDRLSNSLNEVNAKLLELEARVLSQYTKP